MSNFASGVFTLLTLRLCVQVLQWLIVHADTIQSLLRCQELSMGTLQELSLLTGIISKTALPGALEMGGDVHQAALLEFQGHINRFQVSVLCLIDTDSAF